LQKHSRFPQLQQKADVLPPRLEQPPSPPQPLPPTTPIHHPQPSLAHWRVRPVRVRIIRRIRWQHTKLDRPISLPKRTLRRPRGHITPFPNLHLPRRNIQSIDRAFENLERGQGLVKRYFVSGFINTHEGEFPRLFDLPVDYAVGGAEVRVACIGVPRGGDFGGDCLTAEPVAVVIAYRSVSYLEVIGRKKRLGKMWARTRRQRRA
jgi:hypothetical protein